VILPDTNIWMALALSKHVLHETAHKWLAKHSRSGSLLWCRATQQSVLRLLTTEQVMKPYGLPAMTNAAAWGVYESFLADPRMAWSPEPPNLETRWKSFTSRRTPSPKLWMDAYLAAFAVTQGHQLVTTDKALAQFQHVDVQVLEVQ
jgi:uncharacterized protein